MSVDVEPAARTLWLIGRSPELAHLLHPEATQLASVFLSTQTPRGCWEVRTAEEWACSNEATALCLLALTRFQRTRSEEHRAKAAKFLCEFQESNGGWREHAQSKTPSIFTTALVIQALASSGLDFAKNHIERDKAFLMKQQHPLGAWRQRGLSDELLTVTVIESFAAEPLDILPTTANKFLRAARELMPRGQRLLESVEPGDWPLGVIGLYHGLESLLYGCFLFFSPPIPIFIQNSRAKPWAFVKL